MGLDYEPYVSAEQDLPELTPRVIVIGIILGAVMTAANAYLGMLVGMTVSASIPAAVMSMLILRGLKFKDVSILENNSVQTMASAGESLAAGIIFTIPALLVMGIWSDINWLDTFIIAFLGGVLGCMFTIALRKVFIVEEALPYPEGVACKEVLVSGEEGGGGLIAIVYALIIGAIFGWVVKGMHLTKHMVHRAFDLGAARIYVGSEMSIALFSVGYIVGLRIASFIFLGGVLGFGILVPLYGLINGWPAFEVNHLGDVSPVSATEAFMIIWNEQIRFIGVGAMVVGGVYTLWSMRKTILIGFKKALNFNEDGERHALRTEMDLDMRKVLTVCAAITVLTFLFYWWKTGSILLALVGAGFLAVAAFFFSAVAGYIAGVVGSSNSPVSGMTIATLLFTAILVWLVGDVILGMPEQDLMFATLIIAAVVAVNAAIAGDVMQDLKTGHMVGATPHKQQIAEIIGVIVGAIVIGPVLWLLNKAFVITKTHCSRLLAEGQDVDCDTALLAPQAELIGSIIQAVFGGSLNLPMITLGAIIAAIIIWRKMPVMSVAIGIYLPLGLSVPIVIGGLVSYVVIHSAYRRVDGELLEEPSQEAKDAGEEVSARGVLLGAGFIAGESLMGVLIAFFIVVWSAPHKWFGLGTLGDFWSLLFYAWFIGVFIFLATRALPKSRDGSNLLTDTMAVLTDGCRKFLRAMKPQR
ncbi:oligopeptide transporter, OPT family [Deltaproteobacteria bacterium]|nr:oligopeptide transporter, OPT family [Deltaproteobacteria bacterium]